MRENAIIWRRAIIGGTKTAKENFCLNLVQRLGLTLELQLISATSNRTYWHVASHMWATWGLELFSTMVEIRFAKLPEAGMRNDRGQHCYIDYANEHSEKRWFKDLEWQYITCLIYSFCYFILFINRRIIFVSVNYN